MYIVFDVSMTRCLVGILSNDGEILHEEINDTPFAHSAELVPMIQLSVKKAGGTFQDLLGIITTKGPGSFTGIRVGLATAQGLKLALNIPLYAVNTLHALANSVEVDAHHITVLNDTKCGEVYIQSFSYENQEAIPLDEPVSKDPTDLLFDKTYLIGDGVYLANKQTELDIISLKGVWETYLQTKDTNATPLYIRPAKLYV